MLIQIIIGRHTKRYVCASPSLKLFSQKSVTIVILKTAAKVQ